MNQKHIESAKKILETIHYINIATVNTDGTPWNSIVSTTHNSELNFFWGSSPQNIHSQNIERDGRVFVTIYDSTSPEGTGEGLYLLGTAKKIGEENIDISKYQFSPEKIWINDEIKNEDGGYRYDVRIELDIAILKNLF